jgi:hypothetical protein
MRDDLPVRTYRRIFSAGGLAHANRTTYKGICNYWETTFCGLSVYYNRKLREENLRLFPGTLPGKPAWPVMDEVQDARQVTCLQCLAEGA